MEDAPPLLGTVTHNLWTTLGNIRTNRQEEASDLRKRIPPGVEEKFFEIVSTPWDGRRPQGADLN